jgi:hypothetical protein
MAAVAVRDGRENPKPSRLVGLAIGAAVAPPTAASGKGVWGQRDALARIRQVVVDRHIGTAG